MKRKTFEELVEAAVDGARLNYDHARVVVSEATLATTEWDMRIVMPTGYYWVTFDRYTNEVSHVLHQDLTGIADQYDIADLVERLEEMI